MRETRKVGGAVSQPKSLQSPSEKRLYSMRLLNAAHATVTLHARKLGLKKLSGVYLFDGDDIEALRRSMAPAIPGRPRKPATPTAPER